MEAIGLTAYGPPEVLQPVEIAEPHATAGQVCIRVRAAGVNPADVMLRDGSLADWYKDLTPPFVPGMDVAGTLEEIGPDVAEDYPLRLGDDVVAVVDNHGSRGGYSPYVVVPAASVTAKPAGADYPAAASFLMNALTARCALDALDLPVGATVLVTGAAGAVGGYAVQLAAAAGLTAVAVASRADEHLVRGFGARKFIDRDSTITEQVRELVPGGVDGLVDAAMLHERITPAVRDGGAMAVLRFWDGNPGRGITVHPINVRDHVTDHDTIERLREQAEQRVLALRVAGTFPADHAPAAHRRLEQGGVRGRLILEFPVRP
ncbi:NADP-dependent oxidoreductase [Streptomyces sp. NPDC096311]|uniref:NADP-dependent oxidoreductase n=1 Tax=Streptomyces sp. NPDC096311 TaxID=3366083 RepID=UPI003803FA98